LASDIVWRFLSSHLFSVEEVAVELALSADLVSIELRLIVSPMNEIEQKNRRSLRRLESLAWSLLIYLTIADCIADLAVWQRLPIGLLLGPLPPLLEDRIEALFDRHSRNKAGLNPPNAKKTS
jgi:hypothetical protein